MIITSSSNLTVMVSSHRGSKKVGDLMKSLKRKTGTNKQIIIFSAENYFVSKITSIISAIKCTLVYRRFGIVKLVSESRAHAMIQSCSGFDLLVVRVFNDLEKLTISMR